MIQLKVLQTVKYYKEVLKKSKNRANILEENYNINSLQKYLFKSIRA